MHCPYCGHDKPEEVFTDEHTIPRALGGNVHPTNPFLIRVCANCNAACGRWIDGRFVRSWLVHNWRSTAMRAIYDKTVVPAIPLAYMGELTGWHGDDGTVCELWIGPTGDRIYHFHSPYPDASVFAGRPPQVPIKDIDPGSIYVGLVTTNPEWFPIIKKSIFACFKPAPECHILNGAPPGHSPPYPEVPPERQCQLDWIRSIPDDQPHEAIASLDIDLGERFLAKLGLGVGTALLAPSFQRSEQADLLRAALWERDRDARARLGLRGSFFLTDEAKTAPLLAWHDCHVMTFIPNSGELVMSIVFYGQIEAIIVLSNNQEHWEDIVDRDGTTWVLVPGLGRCVGPLSLPQYIAAIGQADSCDGPLAEVAIMIRGASPLPAVHLE